MKAIVVSTLLLIVVEATRFHDQTGYNNLWRRFLQRPSYPYERYPNEPYSWNFHEFRPERGHTVNSGLNFPNAEWVCRNPKTGDMMIIQTENTNNDDTENIAQQQHPSFDHQSGTHNWHHHQHDNPWHNPITGRPPSVHGQDKGSPDNTNPMTSPPSIDNLPHETKEDETSKHHYGEGLIDVRTGKR